jgi:hypothetical protein
MSHGRFLPRSSFVERVWVHISPFVVCCRIKILSYLVLLVRKFKNALCLSARDTFCGACAYCIYVCQQEQKNSPKCFKDTFDIFWICVARATMAEQRSGGVAFSLPLHACRLIRAACMHIMLHANTNLCVGVGYFSRFWWSQIIASECAKISWVFVEWAGSRWGAVYFCWNVQLFWVRQDIYRMLGGLISWIFAQRDSRHV